MAHVSVLLEETLNYLAPRGAEVIVDATLGNGGHSKAILDRLSGQGRLIAFDQDQDAIERCEKIFKDDARVLLIRSNFRFMKQELEKRNISGVDGVMLDLGVSSEQLETAERGFSFRFDGPLDMRMDNRGEKTAADLLNELPEDELKRIFLEYGEERRAEKIAHEVVIRRSRKLFDSTLDFADMVSRFIPRQGRNHPATRLFQALRIAVNEELESLRQGLEGAISVLNPGGRVVVLTYHSLEDRIVKYYFRAAEARGEIKILTKKVVKPARMEVLKNKKSRSGKLRAAVRSMK